MKKSETLALLSIVFMFIMGLIVANTKLAVAVTMVLWLGLAVVSFIVLLKEKKNKNKKQM